MAYTGTICTEAEINAFAGELVDATGNTEANHNDWVAHAESYLCGLMRYNIVDNYASLNADVKRVFSEFGARYAAICAISYNMAGYTSRIEAEDMLNIHIWRLKQLEELIKDQKFVTYIKGAT